MECSIVQLKGKIQLEHNEQCKTLGGMQAYVDHEN